MIRYYYQLPWICWTIFLVLLDGKMVLGAAPLLEDNVFVRRDVPGLPDVGEGWEDSYSDGESCYCATTFDHDIGDVVVDTPLGKKTIREVCKLLGDGPTGREGRPLYNDIQCGNGPPNNAGDEDDCPGRVEYGQEGCKYIGPKWNFDPYLPPTKSPASPPQSPPVGILLQILRWFLSLLGFS